MSPVMPRDPTAYALWKLHRLFGPSRKKARRAILDTIPRHAVCVEIGVWRGDFSAQILEAADPRRLIMVDPWAYMPAYPARLYGGKVCKSQDDMNDIMAGVQERFSGYPAAECVRATSREAADTIRKAHADWIYVDGDHSADAVYADLMLAYSAVRPGGIVAGDDYFWQDSDGSYAVRAGVLRFRAAMPEARFRRIGGQFVIAKAAA